MLKYLLTVPIILLLFVFPTHAISVYGYWDKANLLGYNEASEISGDTLLVSIGMRYSVDAEVINYSNGTSLFIDPRYGRWHDDIRNLKVNVCEGDYTGMSPPRAIQISCINNTNFTFNYSFDVSRNSYDNKIDGIKINLNYTTYTDTYHFFGILITYEIPNFIIHQGSHRIAWFNHYCARPSCPDFDVLITLPEKSSIVEKIPDTAELNRYGERWYVELESSGNNMIWFTDVDETEKWIPFRWALIGGIIGAIIGLMLDVLFREGLKKFFNCKKGKVKSFEKKTRKK